MQQPLPLHPLPQLLPNPRRTPAVLSLKAPLLPLLLPKCRLLQLPRLLLAVHLSLQPLLQLPRPQVQAHTGLAPTEPKHAQLPASTASTRHTSACAHGDVPFQWQLPQEQLALEMPSQWRNRNVTFTSDMRTSETFLVAASRPGFVTAKFFFTSLDIVQYQVYFRILLSGRGFFLGV